MFELSEDQIARFHEDGFVMVDGLIDDATADALRLRYERLFRGEFETGVQPDEVNWREGESDPTRARQICNGWKADRTVASTVLRADIGRAIATLAGWPGTRVMIDNVIWKPPAAKSFGFHQDNAYLEWFEPQELLSCWIALDDTTADGGTMEVVRGSHRWAHSKPEGEFHAPEDYRQFVRLAAKREGIEPDIVPIVVHKGGGSFHHGWTWHGSDANRSSHPRRSLVIHAMSSEARYAADPARLQQGTGRIYSRYKKLGGRAMDEAYFPVTWSRDGHRTAGLAEFCGNSR
jgi:ectoine hydroxylase-related dioxygenase (phytanoyl-CoA dioxygenase family)